MAYIPRPNRVSKALQDAGVPISVLSVYHITFIAHSDVQKANFRAASQSESMRIHYQTGTASRSQLATGTARGTLSRLQCRWHRCFHSFSSIGAFNTCFNLQSHPHGLVIMTRMLCTTALMVCLLW